MFKNIDMSNLEVVKGFEKLLKGFDRDFIGNDYDINGVFDLEGWDSWEYWDICKKEMKLNKDFDYVCRVKELCNLVSIDMDGLGKLDNVLSEIGNWLNELIDKELGIE